MTTPSDKKFYSTPPPNYQELTKIWYYMSQKLHCRVFLVFLKVLSPVIFIVEINLSDFMSSKYDSNEVQDAFFLIVSFASEQDNYFSFQSDTVFMIYLAASNFPCALPLFTLYKHTFKIQIFSFNNSNNLFLRICKMSNINKIAYQRQLAFCDPPCYLAQR